MHELYQTIAVGDLEANTNEAFAMAVKGPVIVFCKTTPKAALVSPAEWNRIAKQLQMLEVVQEALRIEAENDAHTTWVSSSELKKRLAARGIDVGSSLSRESARVLYIKPL